MVTDPLNFLTEGIRLDADGNRFWIRDWTSELAHFPVWPYSHNIENVIEALK
jgi:hypothetical protein